MDAADRLPTRVVRGRARRAQAHEDAGAEGDPRCRGRDRLQIDGRPGEVDWPTREERHQDRAGDSRGRTAAAVVVVYLSPPATLVMNSPPFVPAKAGTQIRTGNDGWIPAFAGMSGREM